VLTPVPNGRTIPGELSPSATHVAAPSRAASPAPAQHVLRSPGRPLDVSTRTYIEPRFGHDFSRVRIHDDTAAQAATRGLGVAAYTVGRDIAFPGWAPSVGTSAGRSLLVHELTHVVQQERGGPAPRLEAGRAARA
jgi:hypothetical protein